VNYVAVKRDVTREMQLESQFRQSQKMEAIGQLAGGVAHDFNNILAVIQLQAGLLKTEEGLAEKQREYANDIEKAAQRAANLTRQLLLFSRKQAMQQRDIDLNETITNIAKMLQRILHENIQMHFKLATHPLLIHADAGMMDQILMNLTVNARDAMPNGGELRIETSEVEFDEATVEQMIQARPGKFACATVTDTGCGIPPEIMPRIFEPFFTTKEIGKGTGLGLATVFGIVQQHQGWIDVSSEPGRGTTFRIYLPLLKSPTPKADGWSSFVPNSGSGHETILLVEDDSLLRAATRIVLQRMGYIVLEAADGAAAVEIWKEKRDSIHLLLTDLIMPGAMNGEDLAEQLLRDQPKLKVIYTSGYSADINGGDFQLEEGINFLAKPYEVGKLAQLVKKNLGER
jgi:nitrogen-specific signal transduction histidine kinase/ActR/RegA family two-component response regulator